MKTFNFEKLGSGLFMILLSCILFSRMNYVEKLKVENFIKVNGTVTEIDKTYAKKSNRQDGWILKLKEVDYKIRIRGESYRAVNRGNFEKFIKPGSEIDVYFLKSEYYGIVEHLDDITGFKDATTITYSDIDILGLKNLKYKLRYDYIFYLII